MPSKPQIILDASAIIAYLDEEAGSNVVERWLPTSAASVVNISEVLSVLIRRGHAGADTAQDVRTLIPNVIAFDWDIARITAEMIRKTQPKGLGIGDRAALATARQMELPVLTAESRWLDVDTGVKVHLIRPAKK